jgi:Xaa-Pro aminopeptidase
LSKLGDVISDALSKRRKVHFLPPYRGETRILLGSLMKENPCQMKTPASADLIRAVVSMRSIKEKDEIGEIEKAVDIAHDMHVAAMKMCREGIREQDIHGVAEGIALARGAGTSFPMIVSINGQTLHNVCRGNMLKRGRMLLVDAGAETNMHYASDITRTTPVNGRFSQMQRDVYDIVLKANIEAIGAVRPGVNNRDVHLIACKAMAGGLKELGIMKGDPGEAVSEGAHSVFMPHGIGHMMGLDVHDMESLGENNVGYNEEVSRGDQFGLSFLRFALPYKTGHVFTIEPGCYFIPELIARWKSDGKYRDFIDFRKVENFMAIGGIRVEDNILVTAKGHKVLGKPVPKTVKEIESTCS